MQPVEPVSEFCIIATISRLFKPQINCIMKKNLFLLSAFLCMAAVAQAQFNPVWEYPWQHTSANNYSNEGRKIALDPAGNIFVLADVTSNINPNGATVTNTQYYVVLLKYSPQGVLLGQRAISTRSHFVNGFNQVNSFGLVVDASGNAFIGYSRYDASNLHDVYITKINGSNMNILWNHYFTSPSNDRGIQLRLMSGVAYALFSSTDAGSSTSLYKIFKASASGSTSTALYTFAPGDVINDFVLDASQNIFCTGYRTLSGVKNVLSARISSTGVLNWLRTNTAGNALLDAFGTACHLSSDNYFYIIGTANRTGTGADAVIIKYNISNGNELYTAYQTRNNQDAGLFINTISNGSILLTGCTSGNSVFVERGNATNGKQISRCVYLPQPVSPFSSIVSVSLNDMKISAADNIYLCGTIRANLSGQGNFTTGFIAKVVWLPSQGQLKIDFEDVAYADPSGNYDYKAMALDVTRTDVILLRDDYFTFTSHQQEIVTVVDYDVPSPLRTADGNSLSNLQTAYSPAGHLLIIQNDTEIQEAALFDMTGRMVTAALPASDYVELNTETLPRGVYILRIRSANGIDTRKINIF